MLSIIISSTLYSSLLYQYISSVILLFFILFAIIFN